MPKAQANNTQTNGATEVARIMLASEVAKLFSEKKLAESIVIVIPDTGKAKFSGSHEITTGKQAGKMSKATFVVAELGSTFAGVPSPWVQGQGDVADLPLSVKLSVTATPPNRDGKTIDEALNRKTEASGLKVVAA